MLNYFTLAHKTRGGSGVRYQVQTEDGDSIGVDLLYTSTLSLATSIPFSSYLVTLRQNGARLFGFANAGTCVSASGGHSLM